MKQCENCFEQNTDGATNCVVCSEPLEVIQIGEDQANIHPEETPLEKSTQESQLLHEISSTDKNEKIQLEATETQSTIIEIATAQAEILPVDEPAIQPPALSSDPAPTLTSHVTIKAAIEVYHDTEPKVVHTHQIVNDITLVGREDAQRDAFPDLDFSKLEKLGVSASHVSREHLRILRQGSGLFLYVYPGSTGTQVNKEVIAQEHYGKKFEINIGDRIILGGKVRLKIVG